jgi:DNA transposition AAA+ family ATPase
MSDETIMEQGRVEFEAPREKRPRGRPPKVALDQGGDGSAVLMDEARAETIIRRVGGYLAAGVRPARILAECESGILAQELERLLSELELESGEPHPHWWKRFGAERHLGALEKWADEEDAVVAHIQEPYAETTVFRRVYGLLRGAHRAGTLIAVTGLYGIGKSFAARQYVLDRPRGPNEPGAVLFEFTPAAKGDNGVLDAILAALDPHSPVKGTTTAKLDRILSLLKPGDFLIADECGIPADRGTGLRFMAYINDHAGIPIAMIGNPTFRNAVWGKHKDLDALANRTIHHALGGNDAEDVDAFMGWRGLSGRAWKEALTNVARSPGRSGGLRGVVLLLDELSRLEVERTPDSFNALAKSYGRVAL